MLDKKYMDMLSADYGQDPAFTGGYFDEDGLFSPEYKEEDEEEDPELAAETTWVHTLFDYEQAYARGEQTNQCSICSGYLIPSLDKGRCPRCRTQN